MHRPTPQLASRSDALRYAYDQMYGAGMKHDSPNLSRSRLVNKIGVWLRQTPEEKPVILNIGAGPQILERMLGSLANSPGQAILRDKLAKSKLISLDLASVEKIPKMYGPRMASHVQADARKLPLASQSIDLVVSNHAIDMLRAEPGEFAAALDEVRRVLKPSSTVLFNYHPADLFEHSCQRFAATKHTAQQIYHDPTLTNPYYDNAVDISADLLAANLTPMSIEFAREGDTQSWWEISAQPS